ncbi:hypothetical protein V1478_016800 [Vespula squamosa]|uniref:LSM domain-containing protein n=1 Tax=Vespula squamosa TaxID=30214 RepID=A0ABD2A0T7_VESSQ
MSSASIDDWYNLNIKILCKCFVQLIVNVKGSITKNECVAIENTIVTPYDKNLNIQLRRYVEATTYPGGRFQQRWFGSLLGARRGQTPLVGPAVYAGGGSSVYRATHHQTVLPFDRETGRLPREKWWGLAGKPERESRGEDSVLWDSGGGGGRSGEVAMVVVVVMVGGGDGDGGGSGGGTGFIRDAGRLKGIVTSLRIFDKHHRQGPSRRVHHASGVVLVMEEDYEEKEEGGED